MKLYAYEIIYNNGHNINGDYLWEAKLQVIFILALTLFYKLSTMNTYHFCTKKKVFLKSNLKTSYLSN